jgi:predicted nucleic acid-binding protein
LTEETAVYVDTSVLVKRYLFEEDSSTVAVFLQRNAIATSAITELELLSALHAAHRARRLTSKDLRAAVMQVEEDRAGWYRLDVTSDVIGRARGIVSEHALRALDAVHCASALILQEAVSTPIEFATSDRRQRFAAIALGLSVILARSS